MRIPILSSDPDAVSLLQKKIDAAEQLQTQMRACNAAIRKHAKAGIDAQVVALMELNLSESQARGLIKPDFCGRIGFAAYELTNNNANIRRMKERIATLSVTQSAPTTEQEGTHARIEDCPTDNRIRLFFPGKPDADVRERLKSSGFRWSPTLGCWQAYRNYHSQQVAEREAGTQSVQSQLTADTGKVCV